METKCQRLNNLEILYQYYPKINQEYEKKLYTIKVENSKLSKTYQKLNAATSKPSNFSQTLFAKNKKQKQRVLMNLMKRIAEVAQDILLYKLIVKKQEVQ